MNNNNFNFDQKELCVLRAFLKQKHYNVIVVGSFALYVIKNNSENIKLSLKFNDLDVDLYKSIHNIKSKSLLSDKKREKKITVKVNQYFHQIIREITSYDNVSNVEVWLSNDVLEEREWNSGTYGGRLLFNIYDEYDEKPHSVYIDINFENKNFDFEINKFKIEGAFYDISTYVYEKILADKYIAFTKHYLYLHNGVIKNTNIRVGRNNGIKDKAISGNMNKLWKDIYDIIFIKNIRTIDMGKVKKYILMMNKRELNLDAIHEFIEIIKNKYPNIVKSRIDYEDISLLVLENYTKLYNKQRKLN